ncbi:sugar phosphate isomerase/epimerase [bacterium]|nr:MAG: sugar phosphate isomerase/epimerase [bacterium]
MKINQVAAQLYTLRDQCKTPDDIARSLEKVAAMGYQSVQVSGLGPIENSALLQLAKDNGLTICATHESIDAILKTPEQVIEKLRALDCQHTAIGYPSGVDLGSLDSVLEFARSFEESAQKFVAAGMTASHHNHQHEFRKIDGKPVLQHILDNTTNVTLELDTYWVQYGGASPVEWNHIAKGRMPLLHLKDYMVNDKSAPQFAEIGNGNLPWPQIIASAEESGCTWFIVEQDTTPGDPFDSLKMSFDYIKANLVA